MQVLFEMMVQIKQNMGIGVETPSPRSFSGGHTKGLLVCMLTNTQTVCLQTHRPKKKNPKKKNFVSGHTDCMLTNTQTKKKEPKKKELCFWSVCL